jgi:predicted transposase YdaD
VILGGLRIAVLPARSSAVAKEDSAQSGRFDELIKSCLQRFPGDLATWLLGEEPLRVRVTDSVLAIASKRLTDKLFEVRRKGRPTLLLHVEFQIEGRAEIPERMAEYLVMLVSVLRSTEHRGNSLGAVVVYLDRSTYREDPGFFEVEGEMGLRISAAYRVIKLWEEDPAPILAMGSPGLLPFIPLMRGNPEELVVQSKELILAAPERLATFETKKDLLVVLGGLATRVIRDREFLGRLLQEVRAMGEEMNPFFEPIFNEGKEIGLKEGRAEGAIVEAQRAVVRFLRRRFGPEAERAIGPVEAIAALPALEALIDEAAVAPTVEDFLRRIPS